MSAPLDIDAIRRDADRMLTVWQQIQNARRPSMITDYLLFVEQSAEDVPPLTRYVTALAGEVERLRAVVECDPGRPAATAAPLDLDALSRLAAAADLPWEHDGGGEIVRAGLGSAGWVAETLHGGDLEATRRYAEYIVAACNALPELIRLAREAGDLAKVTRERDSLARRCALRYEETEKLRAELERLARKRDYYADLNAVQADRIEEAWAEVARLRPVVGAAREVVDAWRAPGVDVDGREHALIAAVAALDADAPTGPERNTQEPCDTCSGAGCAECAPLPKRTAVPGDPLPTLPDSAYPPGATPLEPLTDLPPVGTSTWGNAASPPDEQQYLIWSHHHKMWWGPDGSGYRSHIADAGRYALADTPQWLGRGCGCCRVPEVVIPAPAGALVDLIRYGRRQIKKATAERIAAGQVNRYAEGGDPR